MCLYSDLNLSILTGPCNVQFTTFYFVVCYIYFWTMLRLRDVNIVFWKFNFWRHHVGRVGSGHRKWAPWISLAVSIYKLCLL